MRTVIIEWSSEEEVARCKDLETAMFKAIQRGVPNSDMIFVRGNVDIRVHDCAVRWHTQYLWLAEYLIEKEAPDFIYYRASDRLQLWTRIKKSRELNKATDTTASMSAAIGDRMAADLELLIFLSSHEQSRVFGPDIRKSWGEAFKAGSWLANRYSHQRIILAVHETLGAIVAAPYDLVREYPNYVVKNVFARSRK